MSAKSIEIYEWKKGEKRPIGSDNCIDHLEVPDGGQIPNVGDIISMPEDLAKSLALTRYKVVEREFLWFRTPNDPNFQKPGTWSKMWLYVRQAEDQD